MIGFLKRLLGAAPPPPNPLAQQLGEELSAVFGHFLEFALLRFGKSGKLARQDALNGPMLAYLAEFSMPSLLRQTEVSPDERLFPLVHAIGEVFGYSYQPAAEFAAAAMELRAHCSRALETSEGAAEDLSSYGAVAPLVEALAYANAARQAFDAASGDGSQPDEDHLLAFSTLVGRAWLEAEAG
jgi:hypothetical protein